MKYTPIEIEQIQKYEFMILSLHGINWIHAYTYIYLYIHYLKVATRIKHVRVIHQASISHFLNNDC